MAVLPVNKEQEQPSKQPLFYGLFTSEHDHDLLLRHHMELTALLNYDSNQKLIGKLITVINQAVSRLDSSKAYVEAEWSCPLLAERKSAC